MKPLEPADPRRIGGWLLVRRLATGRTGVVFLARSLAGAPAALKVVRPEHGRNPVFKRRFERNVAGARHVGNPFLVTVEAADTAGGTVWAAFPYLPGPTLTETVATAGPLPARTVRVLGATLAEALQAIHAGGLVHGDVRPGHVLLAPDGPRLTGFGGTGTLHGEPGCVAPEEADGPPAGDGDGPAGEWRRPPGDVFALGCLLALAAAGRPPYGTGPGPELLARVRRDPPDLADVPRSLLEVVQACLAPDPVLRPTAADLRAELTEAGDVDWLAPPLARLVDERYAVPPPFPEPDGPQPAAPEPDPAPAAPGDGRAPASRRRVVTVLGGGGLLVAGGAAVAGRLLAAGRAVPAERGRRYLIGLHADLTGARAKFGQGQKSGLTLAVEELDRLGDLPFALGFTVVDDGGDPRRAAEAARRLAARRQVVAVIGPTGDAPAAAAAGVYAAAGIPLLAVSVGAFESRTGLATVLHARPDTARVGRTIPAVLSEDLHARRVGLVDDRAADTYSWQTTRAVSAAVDRSRVTLEPKVLPAGTDDLAPVAAGLVAENLDAVVYGGFAAGAGRLAAALRAAGFTGAGLAAEGAIGKDFFRKAGEAAEGWYFVTAYTQAAADAGAEGFATVYRRRFGTEAYPYAAEAYDATLMVAEEMRQLARRGERITRAALLSRLRRAEHQGVARNLAFDERGNYAGAGPVGYLYRVRTGEVRMERALEDRRTGRGGV